jgi:hypothetical protein
LRRADRAPAWRERGGGEDDIEVNAACVLRLLYESGGAIGRGEEKAENPEAGAKAVRFRAKADAAIAAERILTGREPDVQDVLNRVFKLDEFEALLGRGEAGVDPYDFLLGGSPS